MCIIAASRSISDWGWTSWSIGEMFVTWWNWHNCFPRQSSLHRHLWKASHKEFWNHQSNHWWKWKPRNDVWDRGTVDFGLVNYGPLYSSQFNTCHDPVFTSLRMVCLDENDNYVEIVLTSCMACTDLGCRKRDTGYPRTNVSRLYVQSERSEDNMMEDDRFLADVGGQPLQKFFEYHMVEAKNAPSNLQTDHKKTDTTPQVFHQKLRRIVYLCLCYGQASCLFVTVTNSATRVFIINNAWICV